MDNLFEKNTLLDELEKTDAEYERKQMRSMRDL